jgi:hypothetical protein
MKWLVGIIVVVIVVVAGWYIWSNANSAVTPPVGTTATSTPIADIIPGVPNQTYTNADLGFSIEYPATASTTGNFSSGYLPVTQTPVIAFEVPQSMFQGTNLVEAGVYVGATSTDIGVANCTIPSEDNDETATSSVVIGGQQFAVFTSSGVGAGNLYQQKTYRTVQNGNCLEFTELLHSGNIQNYPTGSVTQFDQAEFSDILNGIVQTFQPIVSTQ